MGGVVRMGGVHNALTTAARVACTVSYASVPQHAASTAARAAAVASLHVYASRCRYFLVVAPSAQHAATGQQCDALTYAQRGWCRLECWTRRCGGGTAGMYLFDEQLQLRPVDERAGRRLSGRRAARRSGLSAIADDTMFVFEGSFTNTLIKFNCKFSRFPDFWISGSTGLQIFRSPDF